MSCDLWCTFVPFVVRIADPFTTKDTKAHEGKASLRFCGAYFKLPAARRVSLVLSPEHSPSKPRSMAVPSS